MEKTALPGVFAGFAFLGAAQQPDVLGTVGMVVESSGALPREPQGEAEREAIDEFERA